MRSIDLTSVLVAGAIGAAIMLAAGYVGADPVPPASSVTSSLAIGFAIGAGVQIGVRLVGVS